MTFTAIFTYRAMGTVWNISLQEEMSLEQKKALFLELQKQLDVFEGLYSRFKEDSLIVTISQAAGTYEVPHDLVVILKIYQEMYVPSGKKFTPCIGSLLEDVGYDAKYSCIEKETRRAIPDFQEVVKIIDDTHITLSVPVLLDLGAVGKGYCVDLLTTFLTSKGFTDFLVDGSGDVYYKSKDGTISVGLEHPRDTSLVIGSLVMSEGAMCGSATNRRVWGKYSHYVDPETGASPDQIIAVWVIATSAAYADALSSVLFFAPPENLTHIPFEYCCMNSESRIKKSPGFLATFF